MTNHIQLALTKYANSDLTIARKKGMMTVAGTKRGNIQVEYSKQFKIYYLTITNSDSFIKSIRFPANKQTAVDFLVDAYQVVGA